MKKKQLFNVSWVNCDTDGLWRSYYNVTWEKVISIVSKLKPQTIVKIDQTIVKIDNANAYN